MKVTLKTALHSALGFTALAFATAAPTLTPRNNDLGLSWKGDSSLPKVLILFTGGTISSGSNYGRTDNTQYGQKSVTGEDIVARIPELYNISQIAIANFTNPSFSTGTSDELAMNMTRFAHKALCSEGSDIAGAVYTHGTNSLEETAFLMDLLVNCGKPIVGTGAMRPWTALGFDGDANFYSAVALAAHPNARDRGVMIAFNDRIVSGYWATKTNANTPDTFKAYEQGFIGTFLNYAPYFFNTPSQPMAKHRFDISKVSSHKSYPALPQVDIHYTHREFDGRLALDSLANGAAGIVVGGTGNGGIPSGSANLTEAMEKGLYVVVGTRSPNGASSPAYKPTWAKAGYIHLIQARIQLQLAIASGYSMNQTIQLFEGTLRETIGQELNF